MASQARSRNEIIQSLRLSLPLIGRARQPLIRSLRRRCGGAAPATVSVVEIYDAGEEHGIMCRVDVGRSCPSAPYLVVPLDYVALGPRNAIGRLLAVHMKRAPRKRGSRQSATSHLP
jgi:hypothetical protein